MASNLKVTGSRAGSARRDEDCVVLGTGIALQLGGNVLDVVVKSWTGSDFLL